MSLLKKIIEKMKIRSSFLVLLSIITSCNVNSIDSGSNNKIDSSFEEKMNTSCDTNFSITANKIDSTSKIAKLESIISCFSDRDDYEENLESARLLQKIDPFNKKAIEHILNYYESKKIDSISIFFDNLIRKHPSNGEPLMLRAEMLFFEIKNYRDSIYFINQEKYLKRAYLIDSNNVNVCYSLGELYYNDILRFIYHKSYLLNSADNALKYLYQTVRLDSSRYDQLFFPISQLEKFKDNSIKITLNPLLGVDNNCYMPTWYFANLPDNWEQNFSINYLNLIESSKGHSDWIKIQLSALNEPGLYNLHIPENYEVYRFTWLRTFDSPIAIRIVKAGTIYNIYWKVGKGLGGYEPEGIKECGKRRLTENEWDDFKKLFKKTHFDELPHSDYEPSYDGATWTLERATPNNYKAYFSKEPYKIYRLCMFMLQKSGIKVDEKKIY